MTQKKFLAAFMAIFMITATQKAHALVLFPEESVKLAMRTILAGGMGSICYATYHELTKSQGALAKVINNIPAIKDKENEEFISKTITAGYASAALYFLYDTFAALK